jgi:5,10-methylenetetrahydrofolate reductase
MTSRDKAYKITEKCRDDLSKLKLHSGILTYNNVDGKMIFLDNVPRNEMILMLKEVVNRLESDQEHESKI